MAAFQVDQLTKKECLWSDETLASFDATQFPETARRFIDGYLTTAQTSTSDWFAIATIKGCMEYLEQLYNGSVFGQNVGVEKKSPIKYKQRGEKDWDNSEVMDEHLYDLARCCGMSGFYIMHYYPVQYFSPIQFAPSNEAVSALLDRAFQAFTDDANRMEGLQTWFQNYKRTFQGQEDELRGQCLASNDALKYVLQGYEKHECLKRATSASPREKLELILAHRRKSCEDLLGQLLAHCIEPNLAVRTAKMRRWFLENNFDQIQKLLIEVVRDKFYRECIQPNKPGTLNFALHMQLSNATDHWINVTVCKQKDKPPVLVLQDSLNNSLDSLPGAKQLISLLHSTFVKPYMVA